MQTIPAQEEVEVEDETAERKFKWSSQRRAKKRSSDNELAICRVLKNDYHWRGPQRTPSSGPALGQADISCSKDFEGVYHLLFVQLKPWLHTTNAYFSGIQILSLKILEARWAPIDELLKKYVKVDLVLAAKLKGRVTIWHKMMPEDLDTVGLTADILSRLDLEDPTFTRNALKGIPSPKERSPSGKYLLENYYDYITYLYVRINNKDASTWNPAKP